MKRNILFIGILFVSAAYGYTATPSEFPHVFVNAAQKNVEHTAQMMQDLDAISSVIGPISLMNGKVPLHNVRTHLSQIERITMSEGASEHIDTIRLAGLYKLSVPLVLTINNEILTALKRVDALLLFWREAQEYRVHFYLHSQSPKVIVHTLERMQNELCTLLGKIVQQVNSAPFGKDIQAQYAWLHELCGHLTTSKHAQSIVIPQPAFETVAALFTRAIASVSSFTDHIKKQLHEYAKPSWVRRNAGMAIAGAGAVATGAPLIAKHNDEIAQKSMDAYESVKKIAESQKVLVQEAFFDQGKGLADIAQRREKLSHKYRDFLYEQLLEYSSNEEHRKAAILHALNRSGQDHGLDSKASIDTLEQKYEEVYSGKKVPKGKACIPQLKESDYDFLNPDEIEKAARATDFNFFLEEVIPLLEKTLQQEGCDARDAVEKLGPVLDQIGEDLKPLFEALERVQNGTSMATGIFSALFRKNAKATTENGSNSAGAQKPERIEYDTVFPNLTKQITPPVRTGLAIPQALSLAANSMKLSAERLDWQLKWVKVIFLGGIASIPVYGIYKCFVSLYKKCKHHTTFEGLLDTLRELKKVLLVNGDKQQCEMDPYDVGCMYYLIHKLESVVVPKKHRKNFLNDVRLLQASNLSAQQKYTIVKDVLQEGYPFLRPLEVVAK